MRMSNISCNKNYFFCDSCVVAKSHQFPFSLSHTVYTAPLQLVFVDIWGPSHVTARDGSMYYIAFIDAFSRYIWLYLITSKSQATAVFLRFKLLAEKQIGFLIKCLQNDNAKEFIFLTKILHDHGITHRFTCPHTHEQNGSVERKHRHVAETGLALLSAAYLPLKFWGEAFISVVHIISILPTPVLDNVSPHEKLFSSKPNYTFLRIFGCACYPLLRPYNQHKFDFKSSLCLFLVYNNTH